MASRISSAFDSSFFEEFKLAVEAAEELRTALVPLTKERISIGVDSGSIQTIVQLTEKQQQLSASTERLQLATEELSGQEAYLAKMQQQLSALDTEAAKEAYALAVAIAEKKRALKEEAEAQNASIQARRLAMKQEQEERELNRLIAEEEKQLAKERAAVEKQMLLEKAEAEKAYTQLWTKLLAERDAAEKLSAGNRRLSGPVIVPSRLEELSAMEEADNIAGQQRIKTMLAENEVERNLTATKGQATTATVEETVAEEQNLTVKQLLVRQFAVTKKALADVTLELKANEIAFEKGSISAIEYESRMLSLTEEQLLLKKELAGTNATLKEQGLAYDSSVGKLSKFESIVQRMGLRMIANLVIFQAAIELIKIIGDTWKEQSDRINWQQNALKKAAAETANTFNQEASDMSVLKDRWENVATSMQDKAEIVDILNEKFGKQIGAINGINDAEAFFRNKSQAFIDALELRGRAMAAQRALAKIYDEDVKNEMNPQGTLNLGDKIVSAQVAVWNSLFTNHGNTSVGDAYDADLNKTAQAKVNVNRSSNNRIRDFLNQYIAGKNNAANDIDNIYDFDTHDKAGKTPKDKNTADHASAEYRGAKELNDAIADLKKQQIEQDAAANEEIFKNDKASLEDRLLAYQSYESDLIYIAEAEKDKKIANADAELKEIEKLQNDGKKKDQEQLNDLTNRHKAALVKKQAAEEEYQAKIAGITSKGAGVIRGIEDSAEKEKYQSVVDGLKKIDASYQEAYNNEKKAIDEKHTNGTISEKKYQEEILALNRKYAKEILQAQIDNLKDLVVLFPEGSEQAQKLIDKIAELQKKLNETKSTGPRKGVLGFSDEDLKLLGEITTEVELYTQAVNKLNDALDAQSKARIDAIQKEIDAIEKRKQTDIDAVTAAAETGVITADEKARRIAAINAKAQQEEDNRNQKIASEKRQAAERDKALAIAEIVIKTALAVVNQLGGGDPYSAIPRAIAVGVLGAAELAAAIATPIPEFWKGTENAPKGLAKLGEKGAELVIPKHGAPWLADKEMIANLQGGEVIKTHTETMEIMKMFGLGMPGLRPGHKDQNAELLEELQESREVLKAIRDKRFPAIPAKQSWWDHYYYTHTR